MSENQNILLERIVRQQSASLQRRGQQHFDMHADFQRRHDELLKQIRHSSPQSASNLKKDGWDRITAIAPLMSALIIACTGAYFTFAYNEQQLKVQQIQT